jgi:hypothetical protein
VNRTKKIDKAVQKYGGNPVEVMHTYEHALTSRYPLLRYAV